MRDFRHAKTMARTLREALDQRSLTLTHSDSLELVAQILGARNWQTLAAAIESQTDASRRNRPTAKAARVVAAPSAAVQRLPVMPLRDFVMFPEMTRPLLAGRPRTFRAVEQAMGETGELFLVAQRRPTDDAPGPDDIFDIGVRALILDAAPFPDGTLRVTVRGERRARLVAVTAETAFLEAEVRLLDPPPVTEAAQALAREAFEAFARFANFDPEAPPLAHASYPAMAAAPALLADLMTPQVATRLVDAQALLETEAPADRLARLIDLMQATRRAA